MPWATTISPNCFARDVVLLRQVGINPVVVHGGGPQIGAMLERLKIKSESSTVCGSPTRRRWTSSKWFWPVRSTSRSSPPSIRPAVFAVGLSGKDGKLIRARKLRRTQRDPDSNIERVLDLGFVGEPAEINPQVLKVFLESDVIPVIAPTGVGSAGETYNINADTAAGAIAGATKASRLLFLTDVAGVLDKQGNLIPDMTETQARQLIADGTISGGMIPKVETCLEAVERGVEAAVILDGGCRMPCCSNCSPRMGRAP